MIRILVLLVSVMTVMTLGFAAHAQDADFLGKPKALDPKVTSGKYLSNEATDEVFKKCKTTYPPRFTPGSLDYYCSCTSVATQGTLTTAEYESLQIPRNQMVGNPVYDKYLTQVVAPCLDTPTLDSEYYYCVLNRKSDPGIKDIVNYCTCVSEKIAKHVQNYGDADMMSRIDNDLYKDPMEAMWRSDGFKQAKEAAHTQCRTGNWKSPSIYN